MSKTFAHMTCNNNYQVITGHDIKTKDATSTPQESPLAYTTSEIELVIPSNAVEIVMRASTDIRIKTETGASDYFVLPADTTMVFGVAKRADAGESLYFIRDASNGTLNFYFVTVE